MITTLKQNEDGTLLGADEDGKLYVGTPVEVPFSDLTVETKVAKDGKSYTRTTSYKDVIHSQGTVTEEGFNEMNRKFRDLPEKECIDLWEKEKNVDSHQDVTGLNFNTIDWEAK